MTKKNANNSSKSVNEFAVINALRAKCAPVHKSAGTFNQALKPLQGLEKQYEEVCEALHVDSFKFKAICAAWSDELRLSVDGKPVMALYMDETAKVTVTTEKGEQKEVNMYERTVNKKGEVKFRAVKRRVLATPDMWDDGLILEGLIQSAMLGLAKKEAEVAEKHYNDLLASGEVYIKKTEHAADGSSSITFEQV